MMRIKESFRHFLHNRKLKQKLYKIIFDADTPAGKIFDITLIWCILLSVLLVIVESLQGLPSYLNTPFIILEYLFTFFFTFEYLTRIYCSPKPHAYIFSFFGIVDLLATLPLYISIIFPGARYLIIIRAFRLIRIFRIFKLFNFLSEGERLLNAVKESSKKILVFFLFVVILVTSIGTLMYMIEGTQPNSQFTNIPNSIYWAIVTMTTVGYGDITPITGIGRFLSALVMLMGYTIIAVPTGIVSASIIKASDKKGKRCPGCHRTGHEKGARYCKYCGHKLGIGDRVKNRKTTVKEDQNIIE